MLKGQESFSQSAIQMGDKLLQKGIEWAFQKAASWAESELGMTASSAANQAAQTAIQEEGKAAQATTQSAQIMNNAYTAATGAYSAVAGIPIVGPFLAPVAAATAFAGVMAFDVISAAGGMDKVPFDGMPAILHANEMVLPAHVANPLRQAAANMNASGGSMAGLIPTIQAPAYGQGSTGASGGASATSGGNQFHAHVTINGGNTADIQQAVLSTLDNAARNGVPTKYVHLKRAMTR